MKEINLIRYDSDKPRSWWDENSWWVLGGALLMASVAVPILSIACRRDKNTAPQAPRRRGGHHCPSCGLEHEPDAKVCPNPKCGIRF